MIGSEVTSARRKLLLILALTALLALASPSSPMNSPGYALCTAAAAASAGPTRSWAVSGLPVIWKVTSAARPFFESCPALPGENGDLMAATDGTLDRRATRSATAARPEAASAPLGF